MTDTTVQIWRTSSGVLVLAQGDQAWTAVTDATDRDAYAAAAHGWSAGDWEPSEGDGWERVPGSWTAEVDRDDVAVGDLPRLVAEVAVATWGDWRVCISGLRLPAPHPRGVG